MIQHKQYEGLNYWMLIGWDKGHFSLNHECTFCSEGGMITWCWLVISCRQNHNIEELKQGSKNKNTKQSTVYWTCSFKQWAVTRGKKEEIESYKVSQLNAHQIFRREGKRQKFLQNFCLLLDKQVITSLLG